MASPASPRTRPNVFEFQDYKAYLTAWVATRPRGEKSRMAQAARCHQAYLSQVLHSHAQFTLEQAEALNTVLEHTEMEGEFFVLLVEHAKAGTPSLRAFFERKIQRIHNERTQLKNRFTDKKTLNREDQATYYSHWAYLAVHMAVLIPGLRTPGAIARRFDLTLTQVHSILEFLLSVGLVRQSADGGGEYVAGETRIHLEHDSPMIAKHHSNWRLQAMRAFERPTPHELHYSGVVTVAQGDLPRVREVMIRAMEEIRSIIKGSKDEAVYCYAMDLFGLEKAMEFTGDKK